MKKTILSLSMVTFVVILFSNFNFSTPTPTLSDTIATESVRKKAMPTGTSIGDIAPEIEMNRPDGTTVKLSDLRGKVVLIDFWASWCGPCRRENPNVVDVYNRYHDAKFKKSEFKVEHRQPTGFEVFSVSLDSDKARWEQAIEQDGLIWENHVSELNKWNSSAVAAYNVHSIPSAFLIDANGVVIASGRSLRGPGLEDNLKPLVVKTKR